MRVALLKYVLERLTTEHRLLPGHKVTHSDFDNPKVDRYVSIGKHGFPVNLSFGHPKMANQQKIHLGVTVKKQTYESNPEKFHSDLHDYMQMVTGNAPQRGMDGSGNLRTIWRSAIDIPIVPANFPVIYEWLLATYLNFYTIYASEPGVN